MSKVTQVVWSVALILVVGGLVAWHVHEQPSEERRDKYLKCWNAYVYHRKAAATFWNSYRAAPTAGAQRAELSRCREAWGRVEPYEPVGVDPRLADAIAEYKKAWIEEVDFAAQLAGGGSSGRARGEELIAALDSAEAKLKSVDNQVVYELGGIKNDGPGRP